MQEAQELGHRITIYTFLKCAAQGEEYLASDEQALILFSLVPFRLIYAGFCR